MKVHEFFQLGRYVDDTWAVVLKEKMDELFQHITNMDPHIKFTVEAPGPDGGVPFLDTYSTTGENGEIVTRVYRKPTHTDLYLNWHSHHPLSAKLSVIRTLFHRAEIVCSTQALLDQEKDHLRTVLRINDYPDWAIHKGSRTIPNVQDNEHTQNDTKSKPKGYIVVPYVSGLSEPFKRIMCGTGIQVYFKGASTLKSLLCSPKDKDPKDKTQNAIYCINCGDCGAKYIGETGRTVGERHTEHIKSSQSAIYRHIQETGHRIPNVSEDGVQILCKESNIVHRKIIEAMYIKYNDPILNRNIGKMDIPDIYDESLKEEGALAIPKIKQSIPKIKLKKSHRCDHNDALTINIRSEYEII